MEDSKRLLKTLSEILDLSDLETSTLQLKDDRIQVSKIVADIAFAFAHSAEEKQLDFVVDIKNDFFIKFDERYFRQLLERLVENALKFTRHGYIKIICDRENERGILKITDSGIGISPEHYETIFEAFRQASEGFDRSYEGCGLGLTLVKRIIDLVEGNISVESEVGHGTTFDLSFPNVEPLKDSKAQLPLEETGSKLQSLRTPNILLIENDKLNLETFRIFLKNNALLEIAETPQIAVQLAEQLIFDLVLIDIKLNKNTYGIELMKALKQTKGYANVPIIATTAFGLNGDREVFLDEGFSDYLPRPFTKTQLVEIIKKNFYPL